MNIAPNFGEMVENMLVRLRLGPLNHEPALVKRS